jgi:hypothetical protein
MDFEVELLKALGDLTTDEAKKRTALLAIVRKVQRERFTETDLNSLLQSLRHKALLPAEKRRDFNAIVRDAMSFRSVADAIGPPQPPRPPRQRRKP